MLTGTAETGYFLLGLDPAGAAVTQSGAWPSSNIPALTAPVPVGMSLTFTGTTGVFKGAFSRAVVGSKSVSSAFAGVVLANPLALSDATDPVRAAGFYTTGNNSLPVEIQDHAAPFPSPVLIRAGSFQMGNALSASGDGDSNELPVHTVSVSAFYMDKYLVTKALWDDVRAWGLNNGYTDLDVGNGGYASKGANHPVHSITWYAMVKWCNARSQKEGLTPCYTVSGSVYMTTDNDGVVCNMSASGYRLPTEAEWEKAARGGLSVKRFPWAKNTISQSQANYHGDTYYSYDLGPDGYNPTYAVGNFPYTSPVGSFAANGYGLYDMAGNELEWCWDWYGDYGKGAVTDPTGPASGSYRVMRGGYWYGSADRCRVSDRDYGIPNYSGNIIGFRCVRR